MGKQKIIDKKRIAQQHIHLTQPPRLEGKVKNAGMKTVKKPKKK